MTATKPIVRVVPEPTGWQATFRASSGQSVRRPITAWAIRTDNRIVGLVSCRRGLRPAPDWIRWSFAGYLPPGGDPRHDVTSSPPVLPVELNDAAGIFVGETAEAWAVMQYAVLRDPQLLDFARDVMTEAMERVANDYRALRTTPGTTLKEAEA